MASPSIPIPSSSPFASNSFTSSSTTSTSSSTTTSTTTTTSSTTSTSITSSSTTISTTTSDTTISSSASSTTSDSTSTFSTPTTPSTTTTETTPTRSPHPSPVTTFQSTVFIPTTDGDGVTSSFAPPAITFTTTSTASDGIVVTVTEVGINQTLSPDNNTSKTSSFFRNTGAVAGVFVLVGLAAASILLWIFFAVRRRRRTQRLEHDSAVSASLAAAGFRRHALDDDDDHPPGSPDVEMTHRSSSGFLAGSSSLSPSAGARTSAYLDSADPDHQEVFNPYTDYVVPPGSTRDAYVGARTSTPAPYRERSGSSAGDHGISHSASHSVGSYEPLLASYYRQTTGSPNAEVPPPPSPPAAVPILIQGLEPEPTKGKDGGVKRLSMGSSTYSSDSTGDDRLDPALRRRKHEEDEGASVNDLRDDEDYSRPVLGVRNVPDGASLATRES
ncbi:hypothetical protein BD779DRAFT_35731 [Infundibulicybe gibba]|nr:hypothetical protein BD779DRAFT_35731 [Infundibulicybe gibba]